MAKNIVICCDGTGNEFGQQKSNVLKLYKLLVCGATQIRYYHPSVGTMGTRSALTGIGKWWTRVIGLAFGYGVCDNIADAYQFPMRTFQPADRVYVFGFSYGSYTARALRGMLHIVGLLTEGNEGLIPYAIVRHAISIDERRAFFRRNLFGTPKNPEQDVQEVWFVGVHSDVGGSYPEAEASCPRLPYVGWCVKRNLRG